MKRFIVVLAVLLGSQFTFAGLAFIGVDGVDTTFVESSGLLLMDGDLLVVTLGTSDGSAQTAITGASFTMNAAIGGPGTFSIKNSFSNVIIAGTVEPIQIEDILNMGVISGEVTITEDTLGAGLTKGVFRVEGLVFTATDTQDGFEGLAKVNIVVPEPLTMSLLGLGGLFIRRRKAA
jgi:hypothetical protein